jgi:YaiO family outer membrane protein
MNVKYVVLMSYILSPSSWADDYLNIVTLERLNLKKEALQYAGSLANPNTDVQVLMAKLYIQQHELVKAQVIIDQLMLSSPNDSDVYLFQIMVLEQQKNYQQALMWTDLALLKFPLDAQFLSKKRNLESMLANHQSQSKPKQTSFVSIAKPSQKDVKAFEAWAQNHLKKYPKDADVALELAQVYFKQQAYTKIPVLIEPYIQRYPNYIDLYVISINAYIQTKSYSKALTLCRQGLSHKPSNSQLLKKESDIKSLMEAPTEKVNFEKTPEYLNELGVFNQLYYITDRRQLWDYTTGFFGRQTDFGKVYGKVNYANRLKTEAAQFEFEFLPKIGKYIYLDLGATYANQPLLFPKYSYYGEGFVVLPHLFDFSVGGQRNNITSRIQFSRFTFSVSKQLIKNLTVTFRPYFYAPISGQNSIFYSVNIRQMLTEPYAYAGVVLGSGTTPDLANLETVDFIVLKNKIMVSPYLNFSLFHDQLLLNFSFLFQHQLFPSQRVREWKGGTMGATWRF